MTSSPRRLLTAIVGFVAFLLMLLCVVVLRFVQGSKVMATRDAPKLSTRP